MFKTATFRYWLAICVLLLAAIPASTLAAKAESAQATLQTQSLAPASERLDIDGGPNEQLPPGNDFPARTIGLRGPEENFVGMKVGSTWYDKQHNGSVGRNIAQGSDGRIHFTWIHKWNSGGVRSMYYNSVVFDVGQWVASHDTGGVQVSGTNGGYGNIDVWGDLAVPAWHEGPTENSYSIYTGFDFASGDGNFTTSSAPVGPTCSGHTSDGDDGPGNYLWPVHHVDGGFANDPVIHAVGHESTTNTFQSFVYFRGEGNPANWGSCGIFVDSVSDIAGVVRQDPNSDDVAIVWIQPRVYGANGNQYNNDVVYVESPDGGLNWGTPTKITNHVDEDLERPYANLTAMYTSDGCLHTVWDSPGYFDADGTISIAPCRLLHWDDCSQCISEVVNADNAQSCAPGDWCRNATKQNLVECEGKLYCLYSYFTGDFDEGTVDCSAGGWANAEIYVSVSTTDGQTWGTPINLTNTFSNDCAPDECQSETYPSTVMYADSLYTFYVGDTDAGDIPNVAGSWTECPIMFMVNPCFDMDTLYEFSAEPSHLGSPTPLTVEVETQEEIALTLTNSGNVVTSFATTINYLSGSGWLAVEPTSGNIGIGCENTFDVGVTITAPTQAGFYQAELEISYADQTLIVPVDLWAWAAPPPEEIELRTFSAVLDVSTDSRAKRFVWNADTATYLSDGGLILGNSATGQYDFNIFHNFGEQPPPENPWGWLNVDCCSLTVDTGSTELRRVSSYAYNHDSTLAYDVDWYADGHPDTNDFYVLHINLHAGPNFTTTLENVVVAYAADWDIPADTGSDNRGFVDVTEQTVYQQGLYAGSPNDNDQRFGGIAYRGHTSDNRWADGGIVWDNPRYVYPYNGYHVDTLQNRLPGLNVWEVNIPDSSANGDDLNSIIVVDNNATIAADDSIQFNIIFWAINPNETGSGSYVDILTKAEAFICRNEISPDGYYCSMVTLCGPDPMTNCRPGDANGDGTAGISDAVYVITYIFGGGAKPRPYAICSADYNGDCVANISDVVAAISYIFAGGPPPVTCHYFWENCEDPGEFEPGPWK
jgi:hypothetical protein